MCTLHYTISDTFSSDDSDSGLGSGGSQSRYKKKQYFLQF